nr:unnamed protein product [Digitaria exilis]
MRSTSTDTTEPPESPIPAAADRTGAAVDMTWRAPLYSLPLLPPPISPTAPSFSLQYAPAAAGLLPHLRILEFLAFVINRASSSAARRTCENASCDPVATGAAMCASRFLKNLRPICRRKRVSKLLPDSVGFIHKLRTQMRGDARGVVVWRPGGTTCDVWSGKAPMQVPATGARNSFWKQETCPVGTLGSSARQIDAWHEKLALIVEACIGGRFRAAWRRVAVWVDAGCDD